VKELRIRARHRARRNAREGRLAIFRHAVRRPVRGLAAAALKSPANSPEIRHYLNPKSSATVFCSGARSPPLLRNRNTVTPSAPVHRRHPYTVGTRDTVTPFHRGTDQLHTVTPEIRNTETPAHRLLATPGVFQNPADLLGCLQTSADGLNSIHGGRKPMEARSPNTILRRILEDNSKAPAATPGLLCPACDKPGIKSGSRRTRRGRIQRLYCRPCERGFCESALPRRHYSAATIVETVTTYNLGRTLDDTQREIAKRFRTVVPQSTIHSWLKQFAAVCTFSRFRKRYSFSEEETIQSRTFSHRQEYKFKFHRLKANIQCRREFPAIRRYLWQIAENCPNQLFQEGGARCSDGNLPDLQLKLVRKDTSAVPLAKLGLVLAKHRRARHEAVQRFMLANDSATIAVEVPVYLFPKEAPDLKLADVLTGHIDVLQVRFGKVWILDYKPEAKRETRAKYQLYLYARALSVRTGIPLSRFGLAYFDDRDYFEVIG
jgi:transposase-like protein